MMNRPHLHNRLPSKPYSLTVSQSSALFIPHAARIRLFANSNRHTLCRTRDKTLFVWFDDKMRKIAKKWSVATLVVAMFVAGCAHTLVRGKSAERLYLELDYCIAHGGEPGFARLAYDRLQYRYAGTPEAVHSKEKFLPVIEEWEGKRP
jgi:hypothetical protein